MPKTVLRFVGWAITGLFFGLFEATAATFLPGVWGAFHPTFALAIFLLIRNAPRNAAVFVIFAGIATDIFSVGTGTFATARDVLILAALAFVANTALTNHSLYVAIALVVLMRLLDSVTALAFGAGPSLNVLLERAALDILLVTFLFVSHLLFSRRFFSVQSNPSIRYG